MLRCWFLGKLWTTAPDHGRKARSHSRYFDPGRPGKIGLKLKRVDAQFQFVQLRVVAQLDCVELVIVPLPRSAWLTKRSCRDVNPSPCFFVMCLDPKFRLGAGSQSSCGIVKRALERAIAVRLELL